MKKIILQATKSIIPSKSVENSKQKIANQALRLVEEQIKNYPEILGVEFGGSFAKGTWLSKDADVDIFLRFKEKTSSEDFERISKEIGFSSLKKYHPYVRYSEHPYVEAKIKKTKINVVPCYHVKLGKWKSSADRSPFHTRFMKKELTSKMRNEVRLLKTFLQTSGIYGAEVAKQGFSGYVSEVLIINYGSFEKVIKAISEIKENQIIGKASKKFDTPIVITDPIDSQRNLVAAISEENIGKFILICRAFHNNPSLKFFKKSKPKKPNSNQKNILVVKFNFKSRSPDIIWGQINRVTSSLTTQLKFGGFNVLRSTGFTDEEKEGYLLFLLEATTIPENYIKIGPDYFRENDCKSFISKNKAKAELMWIGDQRKIISLEKRKHSDAVKYLTKFLKNNLETGIPKGLQEDFKRGYKISLGPRSISKSIKEVVNDLTSTDETVFYSN